MGEADLRCQRPYTGLAYPILVCLLTLVVGGLFVRETRNHEIDANFHQGRERGRGVTRLGASRALIGRSPSGRVSPIPCPADPAGIGRAPRDVRSASLSVEVTELLEGANTRALRDPRVPAAEQHAPDVERHEDELALVDGLGIRTKILTHFAASSHEAKRAGSS